MTDNLLKSQIQEDMKSAMRARDSVRLGVIRMLMAAIKQKEIDERITLDDQAVVLVIDKMVRQRRDSAEQFTQAERIDLADKENIEVTVLQQYLPQPLSEEELQTLVEQTIQQTGASSIKDMGKLMSALKPKIQGRVDMGQVSATIKALLSNN